MIDTSTQFLSPSRVKTQATLQYESTECGAASLRTILRYFGKSVPLEEVRYKCGINRDGSNAKKIFQAAQLYNCNVKANKSSAEEIRSGGLFPCIIFWKFCHFLVLEGFDDHWAYLSDPAGGRYRVPFEEFADDFTGISLVIWPNSDFTKGGKDEIPLFSLPDYLSGTGPSLAVLILLASLIVVPNLAVAGATSELVNRFLQDRSLYFGIPILWVTGISSFLLLLTLLLQYLLLRRLQYRISKDITAALFLKLFTVPYGFYQARMLGELADRMQLGLQLSEALINQLVRFATAMWQSILLLVIASFISFQLSAFCLLIILSNIFLNAWLTNQRKDANRSLALEEGKMMGISLSGIGDMETIKASGLEINFLNRWQNHFCEVIERRQVLGYQLGISNIAATSSSFFINSMVVCLGGLLILDGNLTLGGLISYQFILSLIVLPIAQIPSTSRKIQQLDGILGRIIDLQKAQDDSNATVMDLHAEPKSYSFSLKSVDTLGLSISCKNLVFGFNNTDAPFFNNINFELPASGHLALVGPSGSGKTTLIKILAGLYKYRSGDYLISDSEVATIPPSELHSELSYVPQDVFMFNQSISSNLRLWRTDIDDESISKAVSDALIEDLILKSPQGLNRKLSTGASDISGGQRQRLEIARSLVVNPRILLLDEATSALDHETEVSVLENIWNRGITTVSVAHRMTSALMGDQVIVLNHGQVIEQGSPQQLLDSDTLFKELVSKEAA